jgi:hypothetical protein
MKTFSVLSLTFGVALAISSCNNDTSGRGTPIDSTNDHGTAPVQYEAGTPDHTVDTTMQSQPMDQKARQDNSVNNSLNEATNGRDSTK